MRQLLLHVSLLYVSVARRRDEHCLLLLLLCEELGVNTERLQQKPAIIIEGLGADEDELTECWDLIQQQEEARKTEIEIQERQKDKRARKQKIGAGT